MVWSFRFHFPQVDLITSAETWITPRADQNQLQISGYTMIKDNRISPNGGGVA